MDLIEAGQPPRAPCWTNTLKWQHWHCAVNVAVRHDAAAISQLTKPCKYLYSSLRETVYFC